jgi:hypothetical protein
MVVGMSFWHRHANAVNPMTGSAIAPAADPRDNLDEDAAYAAGEEA